MPTRIMIAAALPVLLTVSLAGVAKAQSIDSTYTRIDETCTERQLPDEPGVEIRCAGHDGWSFRIAAGEHGAAIAYARAGGTMSDFIAPPMRGLFGGFNDVVEWRLRDGAAFATIHRYIHYNPPEMLEVSGGLEEPNTLIVTTLDPHGPETACAVAHVDASALRDANLIAREAADRLAPGWDCSQEPVLFDDSNPDVGTWLARSH
ncbi:hypothetical protein [Maricaulis sp.]|uniref:hypothetical protein n=2 Tax=Maricaulis sp. TaxID=1486257 RepID=UPI003297EA25